MFDKELFKEQFGRRQFFLIVGDEFAIIHLVTETHEAVTRHASPLMILQKLPEDFATNPSTKIVTDTLKHLRVPIESVPLAHAHNPEPRTFVADLITRYPTATIVITRIDTRSEALQDALTQAIGGGLHTATGERITFEGKLILTAHSSRDVYSPLAHRLYSFYLPADSVAGVAGLDGLHDRPGGCIEVSDEL
jgi:hypothetical protein